MTDLIFSSSMIKKLFLAGFILFLVVGFFLFRQPEKEETIDPAESYPETAEMNLSETVGNFLGTPYKLGPLGEKEDEEIYRTDVFDCTTLVLVSAAKFNFPDDPEEGMKEIHYYPAGEVSYENRLHFSTYRNKISPYFEDITSEIGGEYTESKTVLLNKDELIPIDWQEEITVDNIPIGNVKEIIDNLPPEAGVMFMRKGNQEIGLDINHEGFVFNGKNLVHASPNHGKVYKEDFVSYLENSDYDAVGFYKINKVN